jgi:hypothetical protein
MTPARDPKTEFLCKPIRAIMKEKAMTSNHDGETIGRGIIEKESLGGHRGGITMEEQSLRGIGEASGMHLGGIWDTLGDSQMLQEAPESSRRLQEALDSKSDAPLGQNAKLPLKC